MSDSRALTNTYFMKTSLSQHVVDRANNYGAQHYLSERERELGIIANLLFDELRNTTDGAMENDHVTAAVLQQRILLTEVAKILNREEEL